MALLKFGGNVKVNKKGGKCIFITRRVKLDIKERTKN